MKRSLALSAAWLLLATGLVVAQDASKKNFLWKVEGSKGTVYLLGSVHLAKDDLYPLDPNIEAAFEKSDRLAVELDVSDPEVGDAVHKLTMEKGSYKDGTSITDHLSKETAEKLRKAFKDLHLPFDGLKRYKPWMTSSMLTVTRAQAVGFKAHKGIDQHFLKKKKDRKVVALETVEEQIDALSGGSEEEQEAVLIRTLDDLAIVEQEMDKIFKAWKAGDAAAIDKLMVDGFLKDPKIKPAYDRLLTRRNDRMVEKVGKMLQEEGTTFVVVGAAHLAGEQGLVRQLEAKKFKPQQVEQAAPVPAGK